MVLLAEPCGCFWACFEANTLEVKPLQTFVTAYTVSIDVMGTHRTCPLSKCRLLSWHSRLPELLAIPRDHRDVGCSECTRVHQALHRTVAVAGIAEPHQPRPNLFCLTHLLRCHRRQTTATWLKQAQPEKHTFTCLLEASCICLSLWSLSLSSFVGCVPR